MLTVPANDNALPGGNLLAHYYHDVHRFHQAMVLHIGDLYRPGFLNDDEANLRARMIAEEIGETTTRGIDAGNMIEVIDGIADSLYVTLGTALSIGIDIVPVVYWSEPKVVHDPRALLSRAVYFREMLVGASHAACSAIALRDVDACRATLAGLVYTLNIVVNAWNIPLLPFWDEVQRANMAKWPPNERAGDGGPDGKRGKVRKPPGWRGPDHYPIFRSVFGLAEDVGSGPVPSKMALIAADLRAGTFVGVVPPEPRTVIGEIGEPRIDLTGRHYPLCRTNCVTCYGGGGAA